MAYDEQLAQRIRDEIGPAPALTEKKMFGGLAFLLNGNMAVAASGQGGLMVRCDPTDSEALKAEEAEPMEMRGRTMTGWLRVSDEAVADDEALARWVGVGLSYAGTLPPKQWPPAAAVRRVLSRRRTAYAHKEMQEHSGTGIGGGIALLLGFFVGIVRMFLMPNEVNVALNAYWRTAS